MRFIVDECTGPSVALWLKDSGYDVFSIFDDKRGASDSWILNKANAEKWIVITNDKDFGEKIFRERLNHSGVVLLRLQDEKPANKIDMLRKLLSEYLNLLEYRFVVVTEQKIRIMDISKNQQND